jgi:hypothetical protein
MASKEIIAYHNIFEMFNNHCLAFMVFSSLEPCKNNQLFVSSLLSENAFNGIGTQNHNGLHRPTGIATKSNTNMHNYEHTLHNLLPKEN